MKLMAAVVPLALLVLNGCASQQQAHGAPTLAELSADFRAAVSTRENSGEPKRIVFERATNAGYLAVGAPVENVLALCGGEFHRDWAVRDDGVTKYGIVNFVPPLPSYLNEQGQICAGGYVGWYMVFDHRDGKIVSWRFSDKHK